MIAHTRWLNAPDSFAIPVIPLGLDVCHLSLQISDESSDRAPFARAYFYPCGIAAEKFVEVIKRNHVHLTELLRIG